MSTHRQARRISFGVALGLKRSQISPMACHRMSIVLIALAVQIFAPIAACWAAGIAASDPLGAAIICHGDAGSAPGQSDQTGPS